MNKYLSEEFIVKLLDAHLEDSRGAEHYAYDVIKREIVAAPGVVIEPWDSEVMEAKLFAYRIFCGLISGVLVDTSWENARDRVREYYKDDEKYLDYWGKEKKLCGDDDVPLIEIYDLSERFEDDINYIFPAVL